MTLILSGTNGVTSVNGTAAAPSVTGTDTDTGIVYGTNTVTIATGGTAGLVQNSVQGVQIANTLGVGGATPSTSGAGITFPSTDLHYSSNANTLDDYEEGTWTPAIASSGGGAANYSGGAQAGSYTKIGRQVTASFWINGSKNTLAAGSCTLTGLPFSALSTTGSSGSRAFIDFYNPSGTAFTSILLSITPGYTYMGMYKLTAATTDATGSQLNVTDISSTVFYRGTIVYFTD